MKHLIKLILVCSVFLSCQKEKITLGKNVAETFFVENDNASMRVQMYGNTASKVVILVSHGGPGGGSIHYRSQMYKEQLETDYAFAYWDQRASGFSQGNNTKPSMKMEQYGKDMRAVVLTIKKRYGNDCKIFAWAHSWGGMVTSSFMTQGNNQALVNGWIYLNGTHDYLRNDELTREMAMDSADSEMSLGMNVNKWQVIKDYFSNHSAGTNIPVSHKFNSLANDAQTLFEYKTLKTDLISSNEIRNMLFNERLPVLALLPDFQNNYYYQTFAGEILGSSFKSNLNQVKTPTLVISSAYDFICPAKLQLEFYNLLGSTDKKRIIMKQSSHFMQEEQAYVDAIHDFVQAHR
jgi:pimeloyl-ACP methyl ester carboxylesterase